MDTDLQMIPESCGSVQKGISAPEIGGDSIRHAVRSGCRVGGHNVQIRGPPENFAVVERAAAARLGALHDYDPLHQRLARLQAASIRR